MIGMIPLQMTKIAELEALYAELPKIECKGLCQECCGPIMMSRLEMSRIVKRCGGIYRQVSTDGVCPMLDAKRGTFMVYDVRPMVCRLWGLVFDPLMICPHGCVPERWLSDEESKAFLVRAKEIGGNTVANF